MPEQDAKEECAVTSRSVRSVQSSRDGTATGRSTVSKVKAKEVEVEKKMMDLINQCLDKKVLEMTQLSPAKVCAPSAPSCASSVKTSRTTEIALSTARSESQMETTREEEAVTMANKRAQIQKLSDASLGKFDADQSRVAYLEMQKSAAEARNKNRSALCFDYEPSARGTPQPPQAAQSPQPKADKAGKTGKTGKAGKVKDVKAKASEVEKPVEKEGYDALERYPALLKEMKGLSATRKDAPEGLTSNGKQKQAMKLSDASLGKFDADESRVAYLEMQRSAAEARNKNRSALCFGDDSSGPAPAACKDVTMADKRGKAKRLSDASLGKFDVDQSQIAYLDMQNTAAEMRNKNRVGQGIF